MRCPTPQILLAAVFASVLLVPLAQAEGRAEAEDAQQVQLRQLNELVDALNGKQEARSELREALADADAGDVPEMQISLDELNADIRETRFAIEQIAIGSVDLEVFEADNSQLDWRTELSQVLMPVMQNLKRITEKPRRIEVLKSKIEQATTQKRQAELAAENIARTLEAVDDDETRGALEQLQQTWVIRHQELEQVINLSTVQLDNLQRSDASVWVQLRDGVIEFGNGRGLTLLLAVAAAVGVYGVAHLLSILVTRRQDGEDVRAFRTRQRIVHYGLKAVRTLLMMIAVVVVFYVRGDILLMAISFLIAAGLVLSLRSAIPRFFDELQLLLNLGAIREDERVMYNGLPWKVTQLNMYSVLRNPEITGIIRLPLQDMLALSSRPVGSEAWFPASRDDVILLGDGRVVQVQTLTPEHVTVASLAGTQSMIPTAEFYHTVFDNLTRSGSYFVSAVFGVGYAHQADSVTTIPATMKVALEAALHESDLAKHVLGIHTDLQSAGASSLDIWLGVKMHSDAASAYYRLQRLIQQVCVDTCTREAWEIPFPQLTVHRAKA